MDEFSQLTAHSTIKNKLIDLIRQSEIVNTPSWSTRDRHMLENIIEDILSIDVLSIIARVLRILPTFDSDNLERAGNWAQKMLDLCQEV